MVMHEGHEMETVFFYGLFMDKTLLEKKGCNPSNPVLAFVDGFGLRIGERATLVKSDRERAYGAIMSLREQELSSLYSEKGVADYVPINIVATNSRNESVNAISYNLPSEMMSGRNANYARALALVAKRVGLPAEYVEEIERWAE